MTRRLHLTPTLALAAACWLGASSDAISQVIGVSAPLSGPFAVLGQQMQAGANAAAEAITERELVLDIRDDACTSEGGAAAARGFVEGGAQIVVGFFCIEAIEAAMPVLAEAKIPVITPGVRVDSLTDNKNKTGWPVYRMAPRQDAEAAAIAAKLIPAWREELFAIVDDGTIYGRELAESFRASAEEAGLEPVFIDTYRPQLENQIALVGRLRRAGATHVLVGGDREDIAIMARDAQALDYTLTIAGGEALRAEGQTPLGDGVLMVGLPQWDEVADSGTLERLREAGVEPDGYVVPAHAAVEIASAAMGLTEAVGGTIEDSLRTEAFTTAIGEIVFDARGELAEDPYRLFRFDGTRFVNTELQ